MFNIKTIFKVYLKKSKLQLLPLSNNYPIMIDIIYNDEKSIKLSSNIDISVLNIYYKQPVYIAGSFNYIINITNNIIYFMNKINKASYLILSPSFTYLINNNELNYNRRLILF
jgi:hypothetical protein